MGAGARAAGAVAGVRRLAPRPLGRALDAVVGEARPAGPAGGRPVGLAGGRRAGARGRRDARLRARRDRHGRVRVGGLGAGAGAARAATSSARLNEHLEAAGEPGRVERLRFVVGSGAEPRLSAGVDGCAREVAVLSRFAGIL